MSFPEPRDFQLKAHEALRAGRAAGHRAQVLMAATGSGKCLGRDTPVMMADGSIRMVQDVREGDRLLGPDGSPRNVVSVATGREPLYRITPSKGDAYVVNASHILSLRKTPGCKGIVLSDGTRVHALEDVVNVNVETFKASNSTARHCLKGWRADAIERFERADDASVRKLPAYLLGAWLGDGTMGKAALSKPMCNMVAEWIEYGRKIGYRVTEQKQEGRCPSWLLHNGRGGVSRNRVASALRDLGILNSRHVPDAYKYAPASVRRELLAGLIDSDGHISHGGCDWISKSQQLAEDFAFLCRSLGLACYLSRQEKGIRETGFRDHYWRASVSGDLSQLPMRDKIAAPRAQKKRHLVHGISVERIGIGDYFGFEIDGDRLFLLGDFTVTHNTYCGMRLIQQALERGKRACFVCDRITLIEQTSAVADRYGLTNHGVIQGNHWRQRLDAPFQIVSAQTMARRQWMGFDLIVVDECHTFSKGWVDHVQTTTASVVGLSATPFAKGMGKIFSNLVNAATMDELTRIGVLVPMRVMTCRRPDMAGAELNSKGEWSERAAEERELAIVGDVVTQWIQHAASLKTIVFGATIRHCEEMVRQFVEAGYVAATFTADTPASERQELLDGFRSGAVQILVSVEALAKGFDVPDVGCVCDARPLRKSLSTAIQMWGRGLRSSPGKSECLLLDFSGNILRFANDFESVYFDGLDKLDDGERLDREARQEPEEVEESKPCPMCGYSPFKRRCMSCGHETVTQSLAVVEAGEMREIMIGKARAASDERDLYAQLCTYTRQHGFRPGYAAVKHREITGRFPPRHWSFESMPDVPVSRVVANKIRQSLIAFRHRKSA